VLRAARANRTELTWQPRSDVRAAIVVEPFVASTGRGTVVVGRSLLEVEKRETFMFEAAAAGSLAALGATAGACLVVAWCRRRIHEDPGSFTA
jgi:hypothetical protein